MQRIITVIDLGSRKIAAAMANINRGGEYELLALENVNSRGITAGEIRDMEKTVQDISSVAARLQDSAGRKVRGVFVTARGADERLDISRGMVALSRTPREITRRDVKKCIDMASMVKIPPERAVIQKIVRGFYIDGGAICVKNPVGLYAIKLEAEAFIATTRQSKVNNIAKCVDNAGLLLDGIYVSSVASAYSVLTESEKENGVLFLDIGDSLTGILFFKEGMLRRFGIVGKGARNILDGKKNPDGERLGPILKELCDAAASYKGKYSSVVVTGGGALIDGMIEEIEKALGTDARIGIVRKAGRELNSQDTVIHTATAGLINYLMKERKAPPGAHRNPLEKTFHRVLEIYESYF